MNVFLFSFKMLLYMTALAFLSPTLIETVDLSLRACILEQSLEVSSQLVGSIWFDDVQFCEVRFACGLGESG